MTNFICVFRSEVEYGYVYDVYYTDGLGEESGVTFVYMQCVKKSNVFFQDFDDSLLDSLVSIHPFNSGDDLFYDEYRDDPAEFRLDDDEDSNDEMDARNDYPDEDDVDEDDYYGGYDDNEGLDIGVRGLDIGDLSSEDEVRLVSVFSDK